MGYLDNSTITVDAVLTKQGRRLLARGNQLGINQFCLSDTGVDYNLWNSDHPSGSAYYGEAIENLPQVEALSQGEYFLRNRLVTFPRGTIALPIVDIEIPAAFETNATSVKEKGIRTWTCATLNFSDTDSWTIVCPQAQYLIPTQDTWGDISGVSSQFIAPSDIPNAGAITVYEEGDGRGSISFRPAPDTTIRKTVLFFISNKTGAWAADSEVTVPVTVMRYSVK